MGQSYDIDPISGRTPLILDTTSFSQLTDAVAAPLERKDWRKWWVAFSVSLALLSVLVVSIGWLVWNGTGVWGLNVPVAWGWAIVTFVFWVGIGHAGTLISAVLLLFRQKWRTSINRSAEAMTIFAVICAGIYPFIHMGRPWLAHWVFPYPNARGPLWVNFRSALLWDVFAIGTYFTISLLFWYVGLIPDLATVRDRAKGVRKKIFNLLSFGWRGTARTWSRYETACVLLAALATPLVVSVHSVVSSDFATAVIPGWHATVFPPYFVIGAVFSGFAMVLTLMLVARKTMRFENYITMRHIHAICKVVTFTGSIVGLAYMTEFFIAWYSGSQYELFIFKNRMGGPFAWAYWTMFSCNVIAPQLFWFRKVRNNLLLIFLLSLVVNVGMWFERFVIIVTSLHRDFLPSSWSGYTPTLIEVGSLVFGFGLFFTLFLLFCRFVPMIAMFEVKPLLGKRKRELQQTNREVA